MEVKHKEGNSFVKSALKNPKKNFVSHVLNSDNGSEILSHSEKSVLVAQIVEKEGDLKQYGVLGMKWGVRKDRGSRRTSTSDNDDSPKRKSSSAPKKSSASKKSSSSNNSRRFSDLSDEELKARIMRIENEQKLARLLTPPPRAGKEFVKGVVTTAGKQVLTTAAVSLGTYALNSAAKKLKK